jgi:hypothetical protein
MARTAGIIFSAVMIFAAGLITFLFGALTMWMGIAYSTRPDSRPGYFGSFAIPAAAVLIGLGGWGISSGVGIVKMREWARISMLAFGAIFVVIAAFGALEIALDPRVGVTYLEGNYVGSIRPEMMAFYGVIAALGVFWLGFLSRNSVKARFSSSALVD